MTQLLENRMNVPSVTLLLASNLPPNNYDNNAFRNSFLHEHSRQILFVREERLHSVGDFVVVICIVWRTYLSKICLMIRIRCSCEPSTRSVHFVCSLLHDGAKTSP